MSTPSDEFDDAFFAYVADVVDQNTHLKRALTYIKEHLGQVCPEFAYTCTHEWCNSSCTAWLIADAALAGQYDLPGETQASEPSND